MTKKQIDNILRRIVYEAVKYNRRRFDLYKEFRFFTSGVFFSHSLSLSCARARCSSVVNRSGREKERKKVSLCDEIFDQAMKLEKKYEFAYGDILVNILFSLTIKRNTLRVSNYMHTFKCTLK